jgi:hypothetical protein
MAYQLQVGALFAIGVNTEAEVLGIVKKAQKFLHEPLTNKSWASEGDTATLDWSLPLDYIISEGILFLRKVNPAKYTYFVNSARQIRY